MAQLPVRELAKTLGFQIKTCLNKSSFFEAIKETGPELLIIDTHGGVDETTHNSFIMMGDDIITGDDVVNSGIGPQLVFLSACNTFTTYNTINTIANSGSSFPNTTSVFCRISSGITYGLNFASIIVPADL